MAEKYTDIYASDPVTVWTTGDLFIKSTETSPGVFVTQGFTWQDLIDNFPTIYTANGVVTANRSVDLNGNTLVFIDGDVGIGETGPAARLDVKGETSDNTLKAVQIRKLDGNGIQSWFCNGQSVMDMAALTSNATLQIADNGERSLLVLGDATGTDHWMLAIAAPGGTGMVMLADGGDLGTSTKILSILNQSGCEMQMRGPTTEGTRVFASSVTGQNRLGLTSDDGLEASFVVTFDKKIGFFSQGSTPVVQPASANQAALTNNTAGTYDATLAAIPDPADTPITADALRDDIVANILPVLRDNFTDIHTLLNAMRTAAFDLGLIKGSA